MYWCSAPNHAIPAPNLIAPTPLLKLAPPLCYKVAKRRTVCVEELMSSSVKRVLKTWRMVKLVSVQSYSESSGCWWSARCPTPDNPRGKGVRVSLFGHYSRRTAEEENEPRSSCRWRRWVSSSVVLLRWVRIRWWTGFDLRARRGNQLAGPVCPPDGGSSCWTCCVHWRFQ